MYGWIVASLTSDDPGGGGKMFEGIHPLLLYLYGSICLNIIGFGVSFFVLLRFSEARFFIGEGLLRRGGAIFQGIHPTGKVEFHHVEPKGKSLRGKGRSFFFLPDMIKRPQEEDEIKYNEVLTQRSMLANKPVYLGSYKASLAGPPRLIETIEIAKEHKKIGAWSKTKDLLEKVKAKTKYKIQYILFTQPFSIDTLEEFAGISFTPEDIDESYREGYLDGLGMNPDARWKRIAIPIALVALFLIFIYWYMRQAA